MSKEDEAKRLLRAIGDVDERFIAEAMEEKPRSSKRAAVTVLRQYRGLIITAAAAVIILLAGSIVLKVMNTHSNTATETYSHFVDGMNEDSIRHYSADAEVYSDIPTEEAACAEEAAYDNGQAPNEEETDQCLSGSASGPIVRNRVSEEELSDNYGITVSVPDSINGSVDRQFYYMEDQDSRCVEVVYTDADDNEVCTVRRTEGSADLVSSDACYSVINKINIDGLENVRLFGDGQTFGFAEWASGEYRYSVSTVALSEDELIELISLIS